MRGRLLYRGCTRRCPRCGEWKIFNGYFKMQAACPQCRLDLKREEGYYVGAMTVNILAAEGLTLLFLIVTVIATWPSLPVLPLIAGGVAANLLAPVLFYPVSKTLWLAIDLAFLHQLDPEDMR